MSAFYCIWIKTGEEEEYIKEMQPLLDSDNNSLSGKFYFLRKQMRLKKGKEYMEPVFPGYVFLETEETLPYNLFLLRKGKGFINFLPHNAQPQPLSTSDVEIVRSILKYGTVIPIVHVAFDVNDRIQLLDGPYKDMSAKVVAVNRRNKRVNIDVEFMNGVRVLGLTYEEVRKADGEERDTAGSCVE